MVLRHVAELVDLVLIGSVVLKGRLFDLIRLTCGLVERGAVGLLLIAHKLLLREHTLRHGT